MLWITRATWSAGEDENQTFHEGIAVGKTPELYEIDHLIEANGTLWQGPVNDYQLDPSMGSIVVLSKAELEKLSPET